MQGLPGSPSRMLATPGRHYTLQRGTCQVIRLATRIQHHIGYSGFAGAAVLFACAVVGASFDSPLASQNASHDRGCGVQATSRDISRLFAPEIRGPSATPWAANLSPLNLRRPRLPRHRGERPSLGVWEVEAVTSLVAKSMLGDDVYRPFVSEGLCACPIAGHPLALLRPPSLTA